LAKRAFALALSRTNNVQRAASVLDNSVASAYPAPRVPPTINHRGVVGCSANAVVAATNREKAIMFFIEKPF
jgi:hypothetical protein